MTAARSRRIPIFFWHSQPKSARYPPRHMMDAGNRTVAAVHQVPLPRHLELIFSMLGEAATTEITRTRDAQGFPQSKQAAHAGGTVAGNARRELEDKSGRKVVTSENYLALTQSVKKAKALATPAPPRKPGNA